MKTNPNVVCHLFVACLLMGGCSSSRGDDDFTDGDGDSDVDADSDSDSDADTDADSDADTDADSDADGDADSDADTDADSDADGDADSDADGDADDADGDGLSGEDDNCPELWNPDQVDRDGDGLGDACQALALCPGIPTVFEEEPNDSPETAMPVDPGDSCVEVFSGLDQGGGDVDDWFQIELDVGEVLTLTTGAAWCPIDSVAFVYGPGTEPVDEVSDCTDDPSALACDDHNGIEMCSTIELVAEEPGFYLVRVVGSWDWDDYYELVIGNCVTSAQEVEPNDSMATAQNLPCVGRLSASFEEGSDEDWYRIDLGPDQSLVLDTGDEDCRTDTLMLIYDANADPAPDVQYCDDDWDALVCDDDSFRDGRECSRVEFGPDVGGQYYARILNLDQDDTNDYTLYIETR